MKTCKGCNQEKPETDYYSLVVKGRKYFRYLCKSCYNLRTKGYDEANPEKKRKRAREYARRKRAKEQALNEEA